MQVTNFSAQRKTLYAEVKPYISSGDSKLGREDYWGAAAEYSKAIDKGYNDKDIQVLVPMYKTINGIDNLNIVLQKIFNTKHKHK